MRWEFMKMWRRRRKDKEYEKHKKKKEEEDESSEDAIASLQREATSKQKRDPVMYLDLQGVSTCFCSS